jgi:large subunit ribosomal protein L7/L12
MDATSEPAPATEPTTDAPKHDLTPEQAAHLDPHLLEGWQYQGRRRLVLMTTLSDSQIVELGREAVHLNRQLDVKRQARLARQQALQREKKGKEGALTSVSARIDAGTDEIGRKMSESDLADYSRRYSALSDEYDAFEQARVSELRALKEEVDQLEEQRQKIAAKIREGKGNVAVVVADLKDFFHGRARCIRLDDGSIVFERDLKDSERQLGLFGADLDLPSLSDEEYRLAVAGRTKDAARSYAARTGMTEKNAAGAIRRLLPDEELPPEAPEDSDNDSGEGNGDGVDTEGGEPAGDDEGLPPEAGGDDADVVTFDVILDSYGVKKLPVIKAVSKLLDLTGGDAHALVDRAPCTILRGVSEQDAVTGKDALEKAGGTCRLVESTAVTPEA